VSSNRPAKRPANRMIDRGASLAWHVLDPWSIDAWLTSEWRNVRRTWSVRRRGFVHRRTLRDDGTLDDRWLAALLEHPDAIVESGDPLKLGDRTTVVRLSDEAGHASAGPGRPVVLKRFNRTDPLHTIVHAGLRGRARWNVVNTLRLHRVGIDAPSPRAIIEQWLGPLLVCGWYVCDLIEGPTLEDLGADPDRHGDALRVAAVRFAESWRRLGAAGLRHDDLKHSNFILSPDGRLWLLDLDGMRHPWPAARVRSYRRRDRARFLDNWPAGSPTRAIFEAALDGE